MDRLAGAMRSVSGMKRLKEEIENDLAGDLTGGNPAETAELIDTLMVQKTMLSSMIEQSKFAGVAGHGFTDRETAQDASDASLFAFETRNGKTQAVPLRPLPEGGGWFETVWKKYLNGEVFGS